MTTKFWKRPAEGELFFYLSWWFVALNVGIHLIRMADPGIITHFALDPSEVYAKPWTLITAMFLHSNVEHLTQNMLALFIFGVILERVVGSRNWLGLYFLSGIVGNLVGMVAYPDSISLGASGAITGLVGALAVLRPKMMIYLGGPLPMIFLAGIWIAIDLAGIFNPVDNTGYAVHLAGYAIGILSGFAARPWFKEETVRKKKLDAMISEEEFRQFEEEHLREKKRKRH